MKKALTNPWTDDEVTIDDGLWHGANPREDGIHKLEYELVEMFRGIFADVGEWTPHGSFPELAEAHIETFQDTGLPGEGFVLHMPAVGKRFLFTLTEG